MLNSKNNSGESSLKPTRAQQFNGREGETATFFSHYLLTFGGLGGGFAPRHLNRWVLSGFLKTRNKSRRKKHEKI
jgi:hypothetical protein